MNNQEQNMNTPDEPNFDPNDSTTDALDAAFADATDETIEKLEQQLAEATDRELKAQAELENFRKRIYRETEQTVKYASLPLIRELLEVLDNLTRATDAASNAPEASGLLEGVKMVQQQMIAVFAKYHCKPIPGLGHVFDPNVHQAIAQSPSDEYEAGQVMLEASNGYVLHDRVVRPSAVIVSTGKAS